MGSKIQTLLEIMQYELSPSSTSLGAVVIAVSFLQYIVVFCLLIVILRKKEIIIDERANQEAVAGRTSRDLSNIEFVRAYRKD